MQSWLESGGGYGYRKITDDLRDLGESCGKHRVIVTIVTCAAKSCAHRPAAAAVHSNQGSQFSSHDWQSFPKTYNRVASMSRRGNCHDNALAESFFHLPKRERIRRRIYFDREEARRDVFDYIEMFYNPKRRHGHGHADGFSPVQFEERYFNRLESVY